MSLPHTTGNTNAYSEPPNRRAGTLSMIERWWQRHCVEIASHGYELRPRYDPRWQPSWLKSGKDFNVVEDGQPTIVRVVLLIFHSPAHGDSRGQQWTQPAREITFRSCSRKSSLKRDLTNWVSTNSFRHQSSKRCPTIIVRRCWRSSSFSAPSRRS